jgi:hypothetical protein
MEGYCFVIASFVLRLSFVFPSFVLRLVFESAAYPEMAG